MLQQLEIFFLEVLKLLSLIVNEHLLLFLCNLKVLVLIRNGLLSHLLERVENLFLYHFFLRTIVAVN